MEFEYLDVLEVGLTIDFENLISITSLAKTLHLRNPTHKTHKSNYKTSRSYGRSVPIKAWFYVILVTESLHVQLIL